MTELRLDDRVCMSLGRVTVAHSSLERQIADLICALLGGDADVGEIIACSSNFSNLTKLFEALFLKKVKDADLLESMNNLVKGARTASERRNGLVHSFWMIDDDGLIPSSRQRSRLAAGKGLRKSWEWVDVDEIEGIATDIHHVSYEMMRLLQTLEERGIAFGAGYVPKDILDQLTKGTEHTVRGDSETVTFDPRE